MQLDLVERLVRVDELVHADHRLLAVRFLQRRLVGEVRDPALEPALLGQLDRAAVLIDIIDDLEDLALVLRGQMLDEVRAAERIDHLRHPRFVGDDLLRTQRDLHRFLGRDRERLVHAVRVQALRASQHRRQRLQPRTNHVDRVLRLGQRCCRRLGVKAQPHRLGVFRAEALLHHLRIHAAHGAELGDLLEKVGLADEEEREPRREHVDVHAGLLHLFHISDQVADRKRDLVERRAARFRNVVARDVNRVVALHVLRAVGDAVADNAH